MITEIAPGVHRIEVPLGVRRNSVHLVVGVDSVLLFDAGIAGQMPDVLASALAHVGRSLDDLSHVVFSHCDIDHWGGAGDVRELAPMAMFASHRDEQALVEDTEVALARRYQEFAADHGVGWDEEFHDLQRSRARPVPMDAALSGGERIDLGGRIVEVLHVPGHSRGHLAVWDVTTRTLLVGDAVLGDSVFDLENRLVMPPNYRYPSDYRATCARLAGLEPEWLLAAHFPAMGRDEARRFLRSSIEYSEVVEAALRDALATAICASTLELVRTMQSKLGPWPVPLGDFGLAAMLIGHLEEWVADGRAEQSRTAAGRVEWALRA
ncbi:MBL fold metallo-hydrolase [Agromyces ramosus]|uniref:Glyoxylase-like metal-dependent hydrolase (Beta-lactamase superfamily II) n=1 Tax=Agromyces ramosus TaxID=33879 RepID=A0ABU0RAP3_9MICO|nr:MBL fold metallo-hydrolase [Agromyces ramosus]MDQ0895143.1 glyoxylase-like metal-dependent hydrolase (beta-lactamase superfamily II) [Agromyces ramosus]